MSKTIQIPLENGLALDIRLTDNIKNTEIPLVDIGIIHSETNSEINFVTIDQFDVNHINDPQSLNVYIWSNPDQEDYTTKYKLSKTAIKTALQSD